jgi:AcrR family transcriptional regulator
LPSERRQALIEATARALAVHGAGGVSVRTIAAQAGVSPGLVTHHFEGVEPLIAATYRHVSDRLTTALRAAAASAGDDPCDRLLAYVAGNFVAPVSDPDLLATWLGLLSLTKSMPAVAAAHTETYAAFRKELEQLLADCGGGEDVRLGAIAIAALIDGLWLERCLDDGSFTADEACTIAARWLVAWLGRDG